jgi:hypothetical protein
MILRRSVLSLAVLVALFLSVPAALAQEGDGNSSEPTLESNLPSAAFGERVIVSGANWPPNSIVQVQVCGNLGLNGTSDCDSITAVQSGVNTAGAFSAVMIIGNPPVPCPCVFRTFSQATGIAKTLEFTLLGAAVDPDGATEIVLPERRLDITDARIEGSGPWTALFGAPPDRTLVFTVVNNGFVAVNDPSIVLGVGKGSDPEGFVAPPQIDRLEPGESVTLTVDIDLPAFAYGTYAVVGSIPGFETPVAFRAETSHIPWLLLIIPLLILAQLTLLAFRNRVADRIQRSEPVPTGDQPPSDDAVIDLGDGDDAPAEETEEDIYSPATAGGSIDLTDEVDPTEPDTDFTKLVGEELASVLDNAPELYDSSLSEVEQRQLILDLSSAATARLAERAGLTNGESSALHDHLTGEMLAAFGLEASEPS